MSTPDVVAVVAVALMAVLIGALLYVGPLAKRRKRRKAQACAVNAALASPVVRLQSKPINRAERLRCLDAIWHHTGQGFINQHIGLRELEFADLYEVAQMFPDDLGASR